MKTINYLLIAVLVIFVPAIYAYPPAVGILGNARDCLVCHINNGPWQDDAYSIIDILDKDTEASQKQQDGSFKLSVKRNESKTFLTVIGRAQEDNLSAPYRNAWIYIDPSMIGENSIFKFPEGWEINLPMACRLTGDKLEKYGQAKITVLPFTIRASEDALDAEIVLQVMLTKGETVKGKAKEGMEGSYFTRKVILKIK